MLQLPSNLNLDVCMSLTQKLLDELVSQQEAVMSQLQQPVENSLAKLRDVLLVLNHITDLQNVVDDRYLRVEQQYALLRSEFIQFTNHCVVLHACVDNTPSPPLLIEFIIAIS